jgi:hypothetical protein
VKSPSLPDADATYLVFSLIVGVGFLNANGCLMSFFPTPVTDCVSTGFVNGAWALALNDCA